MTARAVIAVTLGVLSVAAVAAGPILALYGHPPAVAVVVSFGGAVALVLTAAGGAGIGAGTDA